MCLRRNSVRDFCLIGTYAAISYKDSGAKRPFENEYSQIGKAPFDTRIL